MHQAFPEVLYAKRNIEQACVFQGLKAYDENNRNMHRSETIVWAVEIGNLNVAKRLANNLFLSCRSCGIFVEATKTGKGIV